MIWRDPHGAHYLVDHTGTRQVTGNTTGDRTPASVTPDYIHTTRIILDGLAA